MKICYQKSFYILRSVLAVLLTSIVLFTSSISGYCNSTTQSGVGTRFVYKCKDFLQRYWDANVRFVTKYWVVLNSDDMVGTFSDFIDWILTNHPNVDLDDETYDVEETTDGDFIVNNDVKNYINEYMIYEIQQNPLGYSQAYINGWGLISPDRFATEKQYKALQDYIKAQKAPCFVRTFGNYQQTICVAPLSFESDLGFVGDVSGRVFTNVKPYDGWEVFLPEREDFKYVNADGTVTDMGYVDGNFNNNYVHNGNMSNPVANGYYVISNDSNKQLVYVYKTLTDLKRYNSGYPQRYYLTQDGLNGIYNPDLNNMNAQNINYYNSNYEYNEIINNIYPGMSPEDVLKLVTEILKHTGNGNGNGNGNENGDNGWLDLGIFGKIGEAIASILGKIIEAIATIFTEVINVITNVMDNLLDGVIFNFLSTFIGWLPDEIVALLTALFTVSVLFALVRLIKGAFS